MGNDSKVDILVKSKGDTRGIDDTNKSLKTLEGNSGVASKATTLLGGAFKVAGAAAIAAGAAIGAGAVMASKSAFDQVKAVEEASIALRAYEKDGTKVNKVLGELVAYARSDMGVLFQRQDLFDAAQTLKLYGATTESLTDKVKILSKGVALGKTTFQELSAIVGRAAAKGRLDAVDFDMLIERGIGLDKSMRGAAVTSEELFKALDKALPDELLKGRADTIQGRMIRLQSAFRDLGLSILGVDKDTSKFIAGGLGDRFLKGMESVRQALKTLAPAVRTGMENAFKAIDVFISAFNDPDITSKGWVGEVEKVAGATRTAFEYIKTNAIKFGQALKQAFDFLLPSVEALGQTVVEDLFPALQKLWREVIEPMIPVLGVVLVGAVWLVINVLNLLVKTVSAVLNIGSTMFTFWTQTLPNGLSTAFTWIVEKLTWLKDNWSYAIGWIIGFVATLPAKLITYMGAAVIGMINVIRNVNWGAVVSVIWHSFVGAFNAVKDAAGSAFNYMRNLNWGAVIGGIGKGIGNSIMSMIEGAINGALSGIPGSPRVRLPRFAKGVRNFEGGLAVVGEQGPEIVSLPKGSNVYSNGESKQMVGGGRQTTIQNLNIYPQSAEAVREIFRQLDNDTILGNKGFTPLRGDA